jgi:uncharacterized membrane protein YbaN (DUF454 family)
MKRTHAGGIDRSNVSAPSLVVDEGAGFVRVRDPRIFHAENRGFCQRWAEVASRASSVVSARIDLPSATCQVDFRPGTIGRDAMARSFADSIYDTLTDPADPTRNGAIPTTWQVLQATPSGVQAIAPRSGRRWNYVMAAGSLAMTGVALVVPGIPTVPFLLASSYYLARTSPRLNQALRTAPFFGPILQEVEERQAVSPRSKRKLMGFTLVMVAITLLTTSPTPVLFLLVIIAVAGSLYAIERMPEIEDDAPAHLAAIPAL